MKTITALATAKGICAIHIIRLSGPDTYQILNEICTSNVAKDANTIQHTQIADGNNVVDDVLLMKFVAPKSFTGEDLVEINCHGSDLIADKIIALLLKHGAVIAKNGEFSQRALLNNKMNSIQLFAMNNLIKSTNDCSMKYSLDTLLNKEVKVLNKYEEELFTLIGRMEVLIDYPEFNDDDKEPITTSYLIAYFDHFIKLMQSLIHDAKLILPYYQGIKIAIVGVANAGKSSLLNKILKTNKAIVSDIPGTTRDVVEDYINYNNQLWKLQDTAGIRKTADTIENMGIDKTIDTIKKANFILFIVDGSSTNNFNDEQAIYNQIKDYPHLIIVNKNDLPVQTSWKGISINTKDDSYQEVLHEVSKALNLLKPTNLINKYTLQDQYQLALAINLEKELTVVKEALESGFSFDLIIDRLHGILKMFQELIGKTNDLNFIDRLFANFCVGK